MFQVHEGIVSRMPKYKEERDTSGQDLVVMWMSMTVSSTPKGSHL